MPPMHGSSRRRTFLGRLAAGAAAFGAAVATGASPLNAMPASGEVKPARHPQDDWMDEIPGKHRLFLDAVTPRGAAEAITFASNYTVANKSGYGLAATELAIVICYRHFATPFAFGDDAWAKYGAAWSAVIGYKDPVTDAAPVRNVWNARGLPGMQPNRGVTVADAGARGIRFCVCDMATQAFAGMAAQATGGKADEIHQELKRGAVAGNAQFVAAGIVAVGRAQERGYAFSYVG